MNKIIYLQELKEWNGNASFYSIEDKFPFQKIIHQEILEKSGLTSKHKIILDAGCGPGHLTRFLKHKTKSKIIGSDFAPEMIKIAKSKGTEMTYICESSNHLSFPNQSFDAIIAYGHLHHLKAQGLLVESINEFYRILKPNGIMCTIDRPNTRLASLTEKLISVIKNTFTALKGKYSACSTTNEVAIDQEDIQAIIKQGFLLIRKDFLYSLPYKILIVAANFIYYAFGERFSVVFQKITFPLANFSEKRLTSSLLSLENCLIFQKK